MTKIYKLINPDTLEVRYIGKTTQPLKKRLSGHIYRAKTNRKTHVSCWIYNLLQNNKYPIIELIEECSNWVEREQYYISLYPNLCNYSIGGESGTLGYSPTQEHRNKISRKLKNRKRPKEVCKKISKSSLGKKLSNETKEKLRQINLNKKAPISNRIKMGKKVNQYTLDGVFIKEWYSLGIIEETLGFLKANVSSCCYGRLKTAYKYKWSFKNEDIVQSK